jgi:hypothetical protein
MSYQEKRNIVSVLTGALILAAYCLYAYGQYQAGRIPPDDLKAWAVVMLVFIGIGVAATVVLQIVFHILLSVAIAIRENVRSGGCDNKELGKTIEGEMVTDEMDKLIELKSLRVGFIVAGTGFVAALLSQVLNYSPAVMLNVLFISFSAGSLLEGVAQLYFYRRGIRHA